ncbi:MAG: helix-hairpin-helix domain-containing protein [Oscillospiraceae bacterium]|nr:helix-hairpin-helix domain-containing protein [Oscillospiraceae bacterium]
MLKKFEIFVIIVAVAALAFTGGYFTGRGGAGRTVRIENLTQNENTQETEELPVKSSVPDTQTEDAKLNINTAGILELEELPGIGETLAGRIIEYRTENGDFKSIEDLFEVEGIGDLKFSEIKDLITVD